MSLGKRVVLFLATGAYSGNIPLAPGSWGTVVGLLPAYGLAKLGGYGAYGATVLFILAAVAVAHGAEKILDAKDPGCIVIDEIAGILVTLCGLPFNILTAVAGFVFFRVLDITKPFPIRQLDQRIGGGAGVVLDDVAAGIGAHLMLRILLAIMG